MYDLESLINGSLIIAIAFMGGMIAGQYFEEKDRVALSGMMFAIVFSFVLMFDVVGFIDLGELL